MSTCAKRSAPNSAARKETAPEAASPASFHPSKAQIIAGALRPSGRRSQMSGCIRTTVHDGELMPEESTISTMRAGEPFAGTFACVRKERQLSRNGSPYLTVELRDATGVALARAFRDADVLAGRFEAGEIVRVSGRVERFRDELQVDLREIERVQLPPDELARFLPSSRRDLD